VTLRAPGIYSGARPAVMRDAALRATLRHLQPAAPTRPAPAMRSRGCAGAAVGFGGHIVVSEIEVPTPYLLTLGNLV
jgi:hypothetical protein